MSIITSVYENMKDFKLLEDFTFDDCVKSLEKHRAEGTVADQELIDRYKSLLSALRAEENRDFQTVKSINKSTAKKKESLEHFINKYSNLKSASRYEPQYLDKAERELEDLKRRIRNKKTIWLVCGVVLMLAIIGLLFAGYKPVSHFYVSDTKVVVSKIADTDTIMLLTDAEDIEIFDPTPWVTIDRNGSLLILRTESNKEDSRQGRFYISAYPTFFGMRLGFLEQSLTIQLIQQDGHTTFLKLDEEDVYFQSQGGRVVVNVNTDGYEWDVDAPSYKNKWLNVSKDNSQIRISATRNTESNNRNVSLRVYSDNIEKYIYVSQEADTIEVVEAAEAVEAAPWDYK